jgi:hypothetical protein
MTPRRLHRTALWAASMAAVWACGLCAQTPKPTEYQVKAAYLANFGKFIEWPEKPNGEVATFPVCVLGQDPFGPALEAAVAGETIGRAPMEARRITSAQDAGNCRVVFVCAAEEARLKAMLPKLAKGVLTVSDIPDFVKHGGMIQFVLEGNRVRFEVNLAAAQRAGLNLSSELLKLATAVRRAP